MNTKRAACDRCHGQKMRCIRASTCNTKCERCRAAGAECVYSQARKAGRPRSQSHSIQHHEALCNSRPPISTHLNSRHSDVNENGDDSGPSLVANDVWDPLLSSGDTALSELSTWIDGSAFTQDAAQADSLSPLWAERNLRDGFQGKHLANVVSQHQRQSNTVHDVMQQLSELSGRLFFQANSRSQSHPGSGNQQLQHLVANTIESSVAFVNILNALQERYHVVSSPVENIFHGPTTSYPTKGLQVQSTLSGLGTPGLSFPHEFSSSSTPLAESVQGSPVVSDTATTLQILTAYIRLTQVHCVLYTHMQCLLLESTSDTSMGEDARPIVPPFPKLSIGGISLKAYTRFQLKFLLQICVHHLGEIEALLGLPAPFRVGECEGSDSIAGGMLGASGTGSTAVLVRTVMMEVEETVNGIRDILSDLREQLRGSISV